MSSSSSSKGWFNLEAAGGVIPDTQFFEGDSAFSFLGLTRTQRLYGFIGCLGLGFVLSLLGSIFLFLGSLTSFAFLYAIGTIIALIGTGFLIGFTKQLKMVGSLMFKPVRVVATIIFLASIGLIFVGAFVIRSDLLCISRFQHLPSLRPIEFLISSPAVFVIIEYLAYTWYTLSYIPYARSAVLKVFGF
uniref:Protein transport protein SFT2 n=1 Tax=Ganoderma boninense TaxID=34458 RepID=A0A5K1JZI3_9APHY|nr:Pre-mRNA-splicing factor CLF1 (crooked-neck-like protein 1) [Ganoderma boninense]